jgi:hypothetical protein
MLSNVSSNCPTPRGTHRYGLLWLTLWLLIAGCPSNPEPRSGDLIDPNAWQSIEFSSGPFAELASDESQCDSRGIKFEQGVLEIDTGLCSFYTGEQPLATSIRENDTVSFLIYHGALASTEPALGYVALQIGETIVFEREVPIPFSSQVYADTITTDFEAPSGTPVYFHVHNHGANSWRMAHIRLNEEP